VLQVLKATSSSREKKMEKRRGAKTHPCFVPEVTLKAANMSPLSITGASIPSWKERIMFTNLSGQPILDSMAQKHIHIQQNFSVIRQRYRHIRLQHDMAINLTPLLGSSNKISFHIINIQRGKN